jgi:UDP-N-acetylmuramyl pentapeptide synthase
MENVFNIKKQVFPNYKLILVLGDMRELWDFAEKEHRKLAWYVSQIADYIFVVWENMKKYLVDELSKIWFNMDNVKVFDTSLELWKFLKQFLSSSKDKFVVLFKWSQNTIYLEEAIKQVLQDFKDSTKLPRQTKWWLDKKEKFFSTFKK